LPNIRSLYSLFSLRRESSFERMEPATISEGSGELRAAAKLCEDAAYHLAAAVDCELVSRIIVLSAELDQLADTVDARLKA
jgi:hypothetical protein